MRQGEKLPEHQPIIHRRYKNLVDFQPVLIILAMIIQFLAAGVAHLRAIFLSLKCAYTHQFYQGTGYA
jgi:hypothetical protein